ncbi:MAG: response regulator [Pseudomonadota bacterium]|nr:response regulator [Pseudomonadota bacterium]
MKYLDLSMLMVMVVDDNRHMREILVQIMRALGIRNVLTYDDGAAAWQALHHNPVDVVLIDQVMTPVTGVEFTHLVRHSDDSPNPFIPILMVTAYADRPTIIAARNAGVHDIVVKPVSAGVIAARLTDLILRPRNFVRTETYFGPDRREGASPDSGDRRRHADEVTALLDQLSPQAAMPVGVALTRD